jgi:2-keto-3-deoxy-L-rhamnonate aldolase RhmA
MEIVSMISSAVKKVKKAGKCAGGFVPQSIDRIKFVIDLGIQFITYNVDSAILYHAIDDILKEVGKKELS